MKRQLIALSLSAIASLFACSAFAMPVQDAQGFIAIEENCDSLAHRNQRVADNGPDRLVQQYQRVS